MTLLSIAIFAIGAVVYRIIPARWRGWGLLIGSVVALYWLQPQLSVRPMDFVLPTATLVLGLVGWLLIRQDPDMVRDDRLTLGIITALVLALAGASALLSLINVPFSITPSPAPTLPDVAFALFGIGTVVVAAGTMTQERQKAIPFFIVLILIIFVILKSEPLALGVSAWLRGTTGRPISLAGAIDVQWLGFSYVAFRLIHTLRDRQSGKLPALTLREYLTYLIFFPAYTAGPIDRAERFVKDYRALLPLDAPRAVEGASRIVIGIFKKFVIADSLALFALTAGRANEAQSGWGLWVLLYAYAFRIFFDFSGYSDIAIGLGRLFGINLPENFDRPYLKENITTFWQSWHMTLSTWARNYVFTPLTRAIMTRPNKPSNNTIVLITQVTTMVAIGLWHGMTLNFVLWGVWHGIGLWIHKLYTDRTRVFYQGLQPSQRRVANWIGILLTFHFVALGWVFFALPDTALSLSVLRRLFGG
jgi:D-alanyl-lipoteichoic acid acyltransferase DltB (MBOAT superfamily)